MRGWVATSFFLVVVLLDPIRHVFAKLNGTEPPRRVYRLRRN